MSSDSRKKRERLKEEYKEHYRKMREAKEQLNRTRHKRNITEALRNMDTSELMESFDDLLFTVKSKIASVEARLDIAMDNLAGDETEHEGMSEHKRDEEMQKTKARETLKKVKLEMGKLYNEIEEQANNMHVEKTIGSEKSESAEDTQNKN